MSGRLPALVVLIALAGAVAGHELPRPTKEGVAALLGMLNSCASNVYKMLTTRVNIAASKTEPFLKANEAADHILCISTPPTLTGCVGSAILTI